MIKVKGRGRPGRFRIGVRNDGKGRGFQHDKLLPLKRNTRPRAAFKAFSVLGGDSGTSQLLLLQFLANSIIGAIAAFSYYQRRSRGWEMTTVDCIPFHLTSPFKTFLLYSPFTFVKQGYIIGKYAGKTGDFVFKQISIFNIIFKPGRCFRNRN